MKLQPHHLIVAYTQGIFPMADESGTILWFDPDPRAILPLDQFHVPRRLARTVRQGVFEIRMNSSFRRVIEACSAPAPKRDESWISPELVAVYTQLHHLGYAHSVETWQENRLVGGLYGVAINSFFAGESMFSHRRDASKVALVHLVERLRENRFLLLDVQFLTEHLEHFGAREIPRYQYRVRLEEALSRPNRFD